MNDIFDILNENIICLFFGHRQGERQGYPFEHGGFVSNFCLRCQSIYLKEAKKA